MYQQGNSTEGGSERELEQLGEDKVTNDDRSTSDRDDEGDGSEGGKGLKVIVHFERDDHACVSTVDDSHRVGCEAGHPGDEVVFQFGSGDVEVGEEIYACFQGYDDDCRSVINGQESDPEHIYQLR
ncbi:MAG TPA: hypothetical protein VE548_14975 [Nitrososphaeraceae archaeon]|nr:hypothetical protein [Nitrososphaeraceae archaeon]